MRAAVNDTPLIETCSPAGSVLVGLNFSTSFTPVFSLFIAQYLLAQSSPMGIGPGIQKTLSLAAFIKLNPHI